MLKKLFFLQTELNNKKLLLLQLIKMRKRIFLQFARKDFKNYLYPHKQYFYGPRKQSQSLLLTQSDFLNMESSLGISQEFFEEIFQKISPKITNSFHKSKAHLRILTPKKRLWLVLYWLRNYPSYKVFGSLVGISAASISREIRLLLPILSESLDSYVEWPSKKDIISRGGGDGAVDASAFRRFRVHPGQQLYYNGHKESVFHFLV